MTGKWLIFTLIFLCISYALNYFVSCVWSNLTFSNNNLMVLSIPWVSKLWPEATFVNYVYTIKFDNNLGGWVYQLLFHQVRHSNQPTITYLCEPFQSNGWKPVVLISTVRVSSLEIIFICHYCVRIISSTNFNAQFSLFINNMFVTLLSSTCFEH